MRRRVLRGHVIFVSLEEKGAGLEARLSFYVNLMVLNNRSISVMIKDQWSLRTHLYDQ
jgi:hypothetical protein